MKARCLSRMQQSLTHRMIVPAAVHLAVVALSLLLYKHFWLFGLPQLQQTAGTIFGVIAFAAIGGGSGVVYPVCRFRDASIPEAVAASLVTVLLWIGKEVVRVSAFFSPGESLYYGLSSTPLLALVMSLGFMGLGEMTYRYARKRQGEALSVLSPLPVTALVFSLVGLFVILFWGLGVHWFYIYQEGYKALFH